MRILMTTDTVGGVWTYTRELATGLLQRGCTVILISVGASPDTAQQTWIEQTSELWPQHIRYLRTDFKLEWMQDGGSCYEDSKIFLLQCIKAFQADLLHSNQFCYGALPVEIPKVVVAHSDVHSWAETCDVAAATPSPWLNGYDAVVGAGIRGADAIIAPTRWMADQIVRFYHPTLEIEVIANGRSLPCIKRSPKKMQAVSCGRLWDKAKNVQLLGQFTPPLPIKLAGDLLGPESTQYVEMQTVTSLRRLTESELLKLFEESAIYIVTSCYEPFGLSGVEAALCGCAVVANDIPSIREVWGSNAIYFERNNAESLRLVLEGLCQDQAAVEQAAAKALAHVTKLYSAECMTTAYMHLYGKLCQRAVPCAS
ncbi:MAG TPA: glycosyltransferase family 4 protein [Acidobacteriaceae bacterium]